MKKKPEIKLYMPGQETDKERLQILEFKSDRLRRRYDIRNKDPKEINNIFMRAHIKRLKERTEEGKISEGIKQTFG